MSDERKEYEFIRDYPLSGNRKGDKILLPSIRPQLTQHLKAVEEDHETKKSKVKKTAKD
jgi:hypothetical protein